MAVRQFLKDEASLVLAVQNLLDEDNPFFLKLSKFCDTSYTVAILFPVFASLDTKLGYQILLVSSVTEWLNTLMKWGIAEPRPYWWIKEAKVNIPLRQTDITCETGPGSPSGHVMGTAALLYVLLQWLIDWFNSTIPTEYVKLRKVFNTFLWLIYGAIVGLVSLSRMNVAAHFPHQCFLGAILGYLVSALLIRDTRWTFWSRIRHCSKTKMLFLAFLSCGISVGGYFSHRLLGYDPGWSIKMAFKWCQRPTSVSVYTTPIYSLVRDGGSLVGLAIASPLKERKFYPIIGATVTTLFFVGTRMLRPMMPTNDALQFYTFHFLDNLFVSVCMLTVVPYIASLVRIKIKIQ
uniref:Glucose-6-phosphatase n=1 Tax=Lygus hesperus TaxID=30085 RepID=A0A0A9XGX2_LYGHE